MAPNREPTFEYACQIETLDGWQIVGVGVSELLDAAAEDYRAWTKDVGLNHTRVVRREVGEWEPCTRLVERLGASRD